jgi:hypothetical protein
MRIKFLKKLQVMLFAAEFHAVTVASMDHHGM